MIPIWTTTGTTAEGEAALGPLVAATGGAMTIRNPVGKVPLVGTGLLSRPQLVGAAVHALVDRDIAVDAISCTQMRTSMIVPAERVTEAVVTLHHRLGLDRDEDRPELTSA